MVEVGTPFPNFSLANQDGEVVRLNDFTGKWLVVYVYPKDDTPGCTIQDRSAGGYKCRVVEGRRRRAERVQRDDVLEPHEFRDRSERDCPEGLYQREAGRTRGCFASGH
jgi:peroxiredoxin